MKCCRNKRSKMVFGPLIFIVVFTAIAALVMFLWNALIPEIIGWSAISYFQSAGLIVLSRLLLGGMGRFKHGNHHFFGHHKHHHGENFHNMAHSGVHRVRNHFHEMSSEERSEFIRRHMGRNSDREDSRNHEENSDPKTTGDY